VESILQGKEVTDKTIFFYVPKTSPEKKEKQPRKENILGKKT